MSEESGTSTPGRPVDYEEALQIARRALKESDPEDRMVLQEEKTEERSFGWVFAYTTRRYLETGDFNDTVPGVGPLIVFRHDGSVEFLPTSLPPERLLQDVEERWQAEHGEGQASESGENQ